MNVIAYLNGEAQITDQSTCVCVVVRPIAIWINDFLMDSERHILLPYIERAMGSATCDQEELFRRAGRAVKLAEEMQDIAASASASYAADAKAAANAANADAPVFAAKASTCAVKASTYAAKASEYADAACTYADAAYATARRSIIDSCLRFLDDCLPQVETPGLFAATTPREATRCTSTTASDPAPRLPLGA